MKNKYFILLGKTFIIGTISTILIPFFQINIVTSLSQLENLRYGFPFKFINVQSTLTPFEKDLPLRLKFKLPTNDIININFFKLLLSIIVISLTYYLICNLIMYLKNKLISTK